MDGWITSRMLSSIVMPPQGKKKKQKKKTKKKNRSPVNSIRSENIGSKSAKLVVGSDCNVTLTHSSFILSDGQHSSLRLVRGTGVQKR